MFKRERERERESRMLLFLSSVCLNGCVKESDRESLLVCVALSSSVRERKRERESRMLYSILLRV